MWLLLRLLGGLLLDPETRLPHLSAVQLAGLTHQALLCPLCLPAHTCLPPSLLLPLSSSPSPPCVCVRVCVCARTGEKSTSGITPWCFPYCSWETWSPLTWNSLMILADTKLQGSSCLTLAMGLHTHTPQRQDFALRCSGLCIFPTEPSPQP